MEKFKRIEIKTVADYLKLSGLKVSLCLKDPERWVDGIVKDLSDTGSSLVVNNAVVYKDGKIIKEESIIAIPMKDIEIVEIKDKNPKLT